VNIHPSYKNLTAYPGLEASDIQYQDTTGKLTAKLIVDGYLPYETWSGRTPMYYFDVKTTTMECDSPFFMSGRQYDTVSLPSWPTVLTSPRGVSGGHHAMLRNLAKTN